MTPAGGLITASHRRFERTRAAPDKRGSFFISRTTQQGASLLKSLAIFGRALRCALRSLYRAQRCRARAFSNCSQSLDAPCAVRSGAYIAHNAAGREPSQISRSLWMRPALCAPEPISPTTLQGASLLKLLAIPGRALRCALRSLYRAQRSRARAFSNCSQFLDAPCAVRSGVHRNQSQRDSLGGGSASQK